MGDHSVFDWVSVLGPILLSWPLVIAIALLFFYRPIFNLLEKFSSNNIQKAKIGPFEIEGSEKTYVESLKLLLTSFVTDRELSRLQQLNDEESTAYQDAADLRDDLKRLIALGFINAETDLEQLPQEGELGHHLKLTENGKKYLTLRESLLTSQPSSAEDKEEELKTEGALMQEESQT
ncbi:MAG: hypothetical protein WBA99_18525 [Nodosilinea sp.]